MLTSKGKTKIVITIPIYRVQISKTEKYSLLQVLKVLEDYQFIIFTYKGLDLSQYQMLLKGIEYSICYFKKSYFKDTNSYSRLLCSKQFYKAFKEYSHLLIYQLDAWVFRDELNYWVEQGYDYIGAPWFSSDNPEVGLPHFLGVGNGGFSLRNIKSHLKALNQFSYIISPYTIIREFTSKPSLASFWNMLKDLTFGNNSHYLLAKPDINEDVFWGLIIKRKYPWFRAPDMMTAAKFSTETNSEHLYQINSNKLPFGCHAWETYDIEFWSDHILKT